MAELKVLSNPAPELRTKCLPVEDNEDCTALIKDLYDSMYAAAKDQDLGAAGLAANQIGVLKRVFYLNTPDFAGAMINPVLIEGKRDCIGEEMCFSLPGVKKNVRRWKIIKCQSRLADGTLKTFKFQGFTAIAFQHELDHLDGILIVDSQAGIR